MTEMNRIELNYTVQSIEDEEERRIIPHTTILAQPTIPGYACDDAPVDRPTRPTPR